MTSPHVLGVAEIDVGRPGFRKPSVLLSWDDMQRLGLSHLSVVKVRIPGRPDALVHAFVEMNVACALAPGTCALTESLTAALEGPLKQIEIEASDPPEATEVKTSKPLDVHMSMLGEGAPDEMVANATDDVIRQVEARRDVVGLGHRERASRGDGQRGVTVSFEVVEVTPGLVAKMTDETRVLVRGRDWH